jgi:hypothetical protein
MSLARVVKQITKYATVCKAERGDDSAQSNSYKGAREQYKARNLCAMISRKYYTILKSRPLITEHSICLAHLPMSSFALPFHSFLVKECMSQCVRFSLTVLLVVLRMHFMRT